MGLFSSKSSSTSTTYNQSAQSSGSVGDLSDNNLIAGGDIYQEGLSGENLQGILANNESVFDKSIQSIQTLAKNAIETTGKSYADAYSGSQNESSRFFDALRPFAVIAGIVAIFYLWGKK